LAAVAGHPGEKSTKAEAYVIRREEGSFVDFVKGEETHLLIEPLRVLKEDSYRRQIDDFIARFWINIETLASQPGKF